MQLEGPMSAGHGHSDSGGDGPVVVLLHGVLMGGTLWDTVINGLRDRDRCVAPELPFGAHSGQCPSAPTCPLLAITTLVAEFVTELHLHQVTLVCTIRELTLTYPPSTLQKS